MEKRTLQSFSHFSYQISGGQLLIADLNYDKNLKKVTNYKIYFLKDNEYKGILEFFASHVCDNTCKVLELVHPRKKNNPIEIDEKFYSHKYLTDIKLCECCSGPIRVKTYVNIVLLKKYLQNIRQFVLNVIILFFIQLLLIIVG